MGWNINNKRLEKTFVLSDFSSITEKLQQLATICDKHDHHPDVYIYNYKYVKFSLVTHSSGKVTEKDHRLAKEIDAVFG